MANKKMGFEGKVYYGAAGATATAELTASRDIRVPLAYEFGDTTERGASGVPKKSSRVTELSSDGLEFDVLNKIGDANIESLKVAAAAGTAVAIRTKDYDSGKGFDGDVYLTMSRPHPLKGEQVITFTCTPTDENRAWSAYV